MKLDPRTKIVFIICMTTLSVIAKDAVYLGIIVLVSLTLDIVLQINLFVAIKRIKYLLTLIIFIAIMQSIFTKGGTKIVYIKDFVFISSKGIISGIEFALRMIIIILASLIATSSKPNEMIDGLIKLKLPYELAFMSNITLRFIPIFRDEFINRLNAIAMRGIEIKKLSFAKKLRVYVYLLTPTITGTMIKSKYLAKSIESRAFRAYKKRAMLRTLKLKYYDYIAIILVLSFVAIFLYFMITKGAIL